MTFEYLVIPLIKFRCFSYDMRMKFHRIVGVGRDQGHLQQAAQDLVQVGLEYLQRRRLHNLPGQPVPVLRHPQREEVLPHLHLELPLLQFVPVAPCPVAGHLQGCSVCWQFWGASQHGGPLRSGGSDVQHSITRQSFLLTFSGRDCSLVVALGSKKYSAGGILPCLLRL